MKNKKITTTKKSKISKPRNHRAFARDSKKISSETKLSEIMEINPKLAEVLMESGMGCCGCPAAQMETLEQGCLAHEMTKKQIDNLIKKLNKEKKK